MFQVAIFVGVPTNRREVDGNPVYGDDVERPDGATQEVSSCDPQSRNGFDLVPALIQRCG